MTLTQVQTVVSAALGVGLQVQTYMKGTEHAVLINTPSGSTLTAQTLDSFVTAQGIGSNVLQVELI